MTTKLSESSDHGLTYYQIKVAMANLGNLLPNGMYHIMILSGLFYELESFSALFKSRDDSEKAPLPNGCTSLEFLDIYPQCY